MTTRHLIALAGGFLLAIPVLWFRSPDRIEHFLAQPRTLLEAEAAALRTEVAALTTRARERAAEVARRALSEDYASYGRNREVRSRLLEEIEATKSATPFPAAVAGFDFSKGKGGELRVAGFNFDNESIQTILRTSAEQLRGEILRVQTLAREVAVKAASTALSDDYLSRQEEQNLRAGAQRMAEDAVRQARFPAVAGGIVFSREAGKEIVVPAFAFAAADAQRILDAEFGAKLSAVRERDLVNSLADLLGRYTAADRWLDDEERAAIVRQLGRPAPGKTRGLPIDVINREILEYCNAQGVRTGPRPPGTR